MDPVQGPPATSGTERISKRGRAGCTTGENQRGLSACRARKHNAAAGPWDCQIENGPYQAAQRAASVEFGYERSVLKLVRGCERFVSRRVQWIYV